MTINEICDELRRELYNNGYEYGFYLNGKKYKPDFTKGFDEEYGRLSKSIYRIQNPEDTIGQKIATCIDSVLVMGTILDSLSVSYKIWLPHSAKDNYSHTILTFEAESKIVYLELTPQSNKPWYGKEIVYNNEQELIEAFSKNNQKITDVTNKIHIGNFPDSLFD